MSTPSGGKHSLTQQRLHELLAYEPETGLFTWRQSRGSRAAAGATAGSVNTIGYVQIQVDGFNYTAHRLAWLHIHGCWPQFDLDHINCQRADNRIENLRDIQHSHNAQNVRRAPRNSSHGVLGVSRSGNRWRAYIKLDGKQKHLGCFATAEQAHAEHLSARRQHYPGSML